MAPPRILLCGDVLGRLNQLYKRVQSVNKSAGPFDALFCVGQFFPASSEQLEEFMDYIDGRSHIPLPTYFIGDYGVAAPKVLSAASKNHAKLGFKMDGFEISDNLFWLKGSGKFILHGLSIAYLSGRQSADGQQYGTYSQDDADALRAMAEEPGVVDLFLTNEWPSGVTNRASISDIPTGISDSVGSDSTVSELVAEIKPRYHIAGTKGVFFAREPYSNSDAVHVTRFLGLASVGNKDKQKFIHAISPTPGSTMTSAEISMKPSNTTLSPYTFIEQAAAPKEGTKRPSDSMSDSQYWRYDVSQKRHRTGADGDKLCFKFVFSGSCPREEKCHFLHDMDAREQYSRGVCIDFLVKGKCERGPDCNFKHNLLSEGESYSHRRRGFENANTNRSKECWFCLSSPGVESHLIISIGENYYCALAKGPLVQDHILLVPIEHSPNTLSLPQECESELVRLRKSLKLYYNKQGKETILFEWASKRGTHANLQAVPVPSSRAAAVQDIFNMAAEKLGFKFVTMKFNNNSDGRKWLRTQFDRNYSFFYVELPDGTVLSHSVKENESFPAQFGREVRC
ncbi:zinc finger CCCH domain-containing protein 64 isoform X2 [Ricinus communis]|uniref:zinc finger CCCH domain-containing protein 64 isoform X2 n=1 Tax=Ricinus communis TaxID=3988 RepID=UPI0007723822|nr:zinc finger CCCH domain-containing protein 64 isoform X2 [Ricinus communis]XP_048228418.1 zinc finger CCCH domain-containing protein 64 isoform X2 [Ricinus communis]|eukprot:XP_015571722.1 zinc finger CCCH domain-containing protein 64 isoform X2 [Ricinus communis]